MQEGLCSALWAHTHMPVLLEMHVRVNFCMTHTHGGDTRQVLLAKHMCMDFLIAYTRRGDKKVLPLEEQMCINLCMAHTKRGNTKQELHDTRIL